MESESNQPETLASQESATARRISDGIAEALKYGRAIDDETAWLIAQAISPGSGSLHILATTGEIDPDIGSDLEVAREVLPEVSETWIAALDGYCWRRKDRGPPSWWLQPEDQ